MRLEGRLTCGMDIVKAVIGFGPIGTYFDQSLLDGKVDKEDGMSLMSSAEHLKLAGISASAEPNVQADWEESNNNSDAYIKNKPNLATVATSGSYSDLSNKPTIDSTPTASSQNAVQSGGVYTALSGKQDTLSWDATPTENSAHPVTSAGLYNALLGKQDVLTAGDNITISNNVISATGGGGSSVTVDTSITESSTNPVTSAAIYTALAGKQATLTIDDNPTSSSNNPVKSGGVYTALAGKQATLVGSGTGQNIKTVNSTSLVGSGDIAINGITGITTQQDGAVVITVSSGDSYTINLNHVHNKSVVSSTDATVTLDAHIIYDLGTVTGNKTINLPTTVDAGAEYEFRLAYTSGTISGTAISATTVANDATLTFTAGKTYQVIISGGILYFSETTTPS